MVDLNKKPVKKKKAKLRKKAETAMVNLSEGITEAKRKEDL